MAESSLVDELVDAEEIRLSSANAPPFHLFLSDDESDEELQSVIQHAQIIINGVQRIEHFKVLNYIDVVRKYSDADFIMHFRLSRDVVNNLIHRYEASPIYEVILGHGGRTPISVEVQVLLFLWYVGHEACSYRDVSDRFGLVVDTTFNIITRMITFLLTIANSVIRFPTLEEKRRTELYFRRRYGFPGVVGAIDGSHIRIDRPRTDPNSYINRNKYFSLHLQGIADERKKFIDVFVGFPGSVHDARVFKESDVYRSLSELCPDGFHLLGDSAYPCLKNLIVPYRNTGRMTEMQARFNRKLSSCRVVIENTFGELKQRFRQMYHLKMTDTARAVKLIMACCVLHNMANSSDLELFPPPIDDTQPDPSVGRVTVRHDEHPAGIEDESNITGREMRDELCRQIATR